MSSLVRRWQNEVGDAYVVSLVRSILGAMLVLSALRDFNELDPSYFGDVFHLPIVPEVLVPSRGAYVLLVAVELVLGVLVTFGRAARPALFGSALVGLFLLCCDRLHYHNNRYALLLFALLLSFAPCDRAFVLRRGRPAVDRQGPLWAQRLAQVQLALIYVASGGSKLLDPDWRSGLVIGDRLARSMALAQSKGVPIELMRFLSEPSVAGALSKLAISTELFLAVGLFVPRTRYFALWWGVMFHLTIEATSKVELFTWLTFAIYALFASPALRERTLFYDEGRPLGSFVAQTVRLLDWLVRFDVRPNKEATEGRAFVVVERDGSTFVGLGAVARIARAIPLLFPTSVPLWVAAAPRRAPRLGGKTA
jgi:HTTM domain